MSSDRPQKSIRLDYWEDPDSDDEQGHVTILKDPNEIRIGVGKTFIGVTEDSLMLSGGFPSKIGLQAFGMKKAGMVADSPFPLSLLPSTSFTPFPREIISPPFLPILPEIAKLGSIASAFLV